MGQACECLKREELQHLWPALTLRDEGSTPSGCTMDIKLIILALETLKEQVSDAMSDDEQVEDRDRFNRIKREIELFKAEQVIAMFTNKTRE